MSKYSTEDIDWSGVLAMTDEEAYQHALADEDNPPMTTQQLARMRWVPSPREIRRRFGMTQVQFARAFQIAVGTLRDWEQGAHVPDSTAKAFLRVIEHNPVAVLRALQSSMPEQSAWSLPEVRYHLADSIKTTATMGREKSSIEPPRTGTFTMKTRVEEMVERAV